MALIFSKLTSKVGRGKNSETSSSEARMGEAKRAVSIKDVHFTGEGVCQEWKAAADEEGDLWPMPTCPKNDLMAKPSSCIS